MPYFYMQKPVKGQTNTNRPVTVRSVKRRDKAKVEEKNNRMVHGNYIFINNIMQLQKKTWIFIFQDH